jgi:hypothetical protein
MPPASPAAATGGSAPPAGGPAGALVVATPGGMNLVTNVIGLVGARAGVRRSPAAVLRSE